VYDRQQVHTSAASAEDLIRSQELDYDSVETAPSCWGRGNEEQITPQMFHQQVKEAEADEGANKA